MDIENQNEEIEERTGVFENEQTPDAESGANDELKSAIEDTLDKIRRQAMLLGAQSMCQIILDKITVFERMPGSKSNNDHKRLIKDIKKFVETGLSRKVNLDGETEPVEETIQN